MNWKKAGIGTGVGAVVLLLSLMLRGCFSSGATTIEDVPLQQQLIEEKVQTKFRDEKIKLLQEQLTMANTNLKLQEAVVKLEVQLQELTSKVQAGLPELAKQKQALELEKSEVARLRAKKEEELARMQAQKEEEWNARESKVKEDEERIKKKREELEEIIEAEVKKEEKKKDTAWRRFESEIAKRKKLMETLEKPLELTPGGVPKPGTMGYVEKVAKKKILEKEIQDLEREQKSVEEKFEATASRLRDKG